MYDCRYWIWLAEKFEPGSIRCDKLLLAFNNDPKAIYDADRSAYESICSSNPRILNALCDKNLDGVYKTLEFCQKYNVGIITPDDELYPSAFECIDGRPPVIYYKGIIPKFDNNLTISIVGTRSVTSYGSDAAYTMAHDIASAGGIIVSGMALGCDTAAHRGALDAKGTTVAFLGCGIDVVYPKANDYLMQEIINSGAVMTDYPPHSRPEGRHFPVRNRLISAVGNGVVIVEAGEKSGALITADHAVKQGKPLYAVPGKIGDLNSKGPNKLIKAGARMVADAYDIVNDYKLLFSLNDNISITPFKRIRPTKDRRTIQNQPCPSPTYNPFAVTKSGYSDKNNRDAFYDKFMHYDPTPPKPAEAPQPIQEQNTPRYIDLAASDRNSDTELKISSPKPRLIFRDFDDDEFAKAYMSMPAEEKAEIDRLDLLGGRPTIKYPNEPMPKDGYTVEVTQEKLDYYRQNKYDKVSPDTLPKTAFEVRPLVECVTDIKELERLYDKDLLDSQKRAAKKQLEAATGFKDYTGLTSAEISILKLLEDGKRITVDSMSHLGIPLSKLLSVLTVLEIKKLIIQHPGGYFELNRNY